MVNTVVIALRNYRQEFPPVYSIERWIDRRVELALARLARRRAFLIFHIQTDLVGWRRADLPRFLGCGGVGSTRLHRAAVLHIRKQTVVIWSRDPLRIARVDSTHHPRPRGSLLRLPPRPQHHQATRRPQGRASPTLWKR